MICRIWHGWTDPEKADQYENLLRSEVLPGIPRIEGYKGSQLLRTNLNTEVEFVTLTYFESMTDVEKFAGKDYEKAVVPPEARKLLKRFDERSKHYEIIYKLS